MGGKTHRISFQLQDPSGHTISTQFEDYGPCSTRDGLYYLDQLETKGMSEFSTNSDKHAFSEAIGDAKRWVRNASNMGPEGQSQTVARFITGERIKCRIDIHIHAGNGHFTN